MYLVEISVAHKKTNSFIKFAYLQILSIKDESTFFLLTHF